jgi:hypothetical protein
MTSSRTILAVPSALALAFLGAAASAQGLSGLGATHIHGQPRDQIRSYPSDAEVMAVWPAAAKAKGLGGSAVMHCVADDAGALTDCQLMLERNHAGFGPALLSLAPRYHLRPANGGKRPNGDEVVVTATWPAPDTPVEWQEKPKPGDFSTTLTTAAWRAGGEGQAVMNCLIARLGAMHDCMVIYQSPAGKGFGSMALRFQGLLKLKPATVAGKPIATGEDIVFDFRPLRPGEAP